MARIRTIKPEFWSSADVVCLSYTARLLFIGLWVFADDQGVIPAGAAGLKMKIFPGDKLSMDEINQLLTELKTGGLIVSYHEKGKEFFFITGWHHQKIAKKTAKYPPPPTTGVLPEPSRTDVDVDVDTYVDIEKRVFVFNSKKIQIPHHLRKKEFLELLGLWLKWKQTQPAGKHRWTNTNGPVMFLSRLKPHSLAEAVEAIQRALETGSQTAYPKTSGYQKTEAQTRGGQVRTDPKLAKELELGAHLKRLRQALAKEEDQEQRKLLEQSIKQTEAERDQVAQGAAR